VPAGATIILKYDTAASKWRVVGGSGGGGSGTPNINYVTDSGAEAEFESGQTTGYAAYANAVAAATPETGTGGSPSVTFTASATDPLRGAYSAILSKGASNLQGEGVSVLCDIPLADRGKPLSF